MVFTKMWEMQGLGKESTPAAVSDTSFYSCNTAACSNTEGAALFTKKGREAYVSLQHSPVTPGPALPAGAGARPSGCAWLRRARTRTTRQRACIAGGMPSCATPPPPDGESGAAADTCACTAAAPTARTPSPSPCGPSAPGPCAARVCVRELAPRL